MDCVKVNSLVRFYVFLLLHDGKKHGYELMKIIGEKLGEKPSPGQLYPFLSELTAAKLVRIASTGQREKKSYVLTAKGNVFFETLLKRFDYLITAAVSKDAVICAHCGCKMYSVGHSESVKGKKLDFCCIHCADSYRHSVL